MNRCISTLRACAIAGCLAMGGCFGQLPIVVEAPDEATEVFQQDHAVGNIGVVRVTNVVGRVEIEADDVDQISVRAIKRGRGLSPELAQEALARIDATTSVVAGDPAVLEAVATHPMGVTLRQFEVSWHIIVPRDLRVEVVNQEGDTSVVGTRSDVQAKLEVGSVMVSNVRGDVRAEVGSGNVVLGNVIGNASVQVKSGDVAAVLAPPPGAVEIDLNTESGQVDLTVPSGTSAVLTASTTLGLLDTALGKFETSNLSVDSRVAQSLTVSLNGGTGGTIRLRAEEGAIHFRGA